MQQARITQNSYLPRGFRTRISKGQKQVITNRWLMLFSSVPDSHHSQLRDTCFPSQLLWLAEKSLFSQTVIIASCKLLLSLD